MNMEWISIGLQVFAVVTGACGAIAAILPAGKVQHWFAWVGTFASKKPIEFPAATEKP